MHSFDPDCIKLAQLHAKAVDYRKTGQAVHRRDVPMPPFGVSRPDFLCQRPAGPGIYPSSRALGQLFRAIPEQLTDMPHGPQPAWINEGRQSALSDILRQPGKSDDILSILTILAQKYPQIMPEGLQLEAFKEPFWPLLASFVYHLSRLAAWIPESRTETEWLSEEEILVGTQVMAAKAQQLKRRQERLTASTSELFPILKAQMQLLAEDENVKTSTIMMTGGENQPVNQLPRTVPGAGPSNGKGKGKAVAPPTMPTGRDGTVHFSGLTRLVETPRRAKIAVVDGERVVLRAQTSTTNTPAGWSDDEDFDNQNLRQQRKVKHFLNEHLDTAVSSSRSAKLSNAQQPNGRTNGHVKANCNGKARANGNGTNRASHNGRQNMNGNGKQKRALATTEPELYRILREEGSDDSDLEWEYRHGMPKEDRWMTPEEWARHSRRKELQKLYAACYLGASEITTRHFGGNTFAVVALGCLLERLEEFTARGWLF